MVTIRDVLIELLLAVACSVIGLWVLFETQFPLLIFPMIIVYGIIHLILKRFKRIKDYVQADFNQMGFTILEERPPKISEVKVTVEPVFVTINGTPLSRYRYVRKFARVFIVESKNGNRFELNTIVTRKWDASNQVEIISKRRL